MLAAMSSKCLAKVRQAISPVEENKEAAFARLGTCPLHCEICFEQDLSTENVRHCIGYAIAMRKAGEVP